MAPPILDIPARRASSGRRWLARSIDWLVPWLIGSPLWILSLAQIKSEALERTHGLVDLDSTSLIFGRWGTAAEDTLAALNGFWSTIVLFAVGTLAVQVIVVALYDAALHLWCERTIGKIALSLKLISTSEKGRLAFGQAIARTAFTVLLPGFAWVVLFAALLEMSFPLALLGVVLLSLSVIECAALRSSPTGMTCWHDRRTRTAVVPARP